MQKKVEKLQITEHIPSMQVCIPKINANQNDDMTRRGGAREKR